MKVLLLTTKTDHHLFFINKIKKKIKNLYVFIEEKKINFQFKVKHPYLKQRSIFEKKYFFNNKKNIFPSHQSFKDINNINSINCAKKIDPDIIILFGTGLLKKKFLKKFKKKHIINLHGGDPENYRGLDSILWSLYHMDKNGLVTTLHYVNKKFDRGKIIFKRKITFDKKISIHSIRAYNTENCVYLFLKFLRRIQNGNKIISYNQNSIGRYYSAIPSILINEAIKNLKKLQRKI